MRKSKVKELSMIVNVSFEEAVDSLRENDWDINSASQKLAVLRNFYEEERKISRTSPRHVPGYAFYLPDLERLPVDFRNFLEKDLIEASTQRRLENSKHLNWWHQFGQKLYPLSTTGDGNCLLHAASLGMWGLHDRQLTLRETLYEMLMKGSRRTALWRRWKWAEHNAIHSSELALTLSDEEWEQEWNSIISLASPIPRKQDETRSDSTDQIYESLESIHVFALAHVLKRPIIIVSDTVLRNAKGEELSPVLFGGIYLPLECSPEQCHRSPLVLCYDSAHFSPLVPMRHDTNLQQIIPILDANRNLLPVHYAIDPGPDFTWWRDEADMQIASRLNMTETDKLSLVSEYMDIVRLDLRRGSVRSSRRVRSALSPAPPVNCDATLVEASVAPPATTKKGMTLASSGISQGRHEKRRIFVEITQHILRTLKFSNGKHKEKCITAEECVNTMNKTTSVLAAQLATSSHEYMDVMVREYMKSAQQRFQQNHKSTTTTDGRKRISRSFSASSLMITCINNSCNQPASQATNFLCDECFAQQKLLMMSFNCERPNLLRRPPVSMTAAAATVKSTTMPLLNGLSNGNTKVGNTSPVLGVTSRDGSSKTSNVRAVEDADGVTHYFVSEENLAVN
ncbi:unnamed protein product [Caenorhabditis auriculariae]|uniref:ubiquitinyl hydrolase 1 n=1 Tax=Caenorhabditis auriculariae TaxID=2777116 RepID=A0A8S1GSK6_9PELO|nr:unnamed protein product [Caenorhabditis auriculariae]